MLPQLKIQTIKRRIFQTMRSTKEIDWNKYLPRITRFMNQTPTKSIGNLRPSGTFIKDVLFFCNFWTYLPTFFRFFTYLPKNWTSFINVPADVRTPDGDSIIIDRLTKLRNDGEKVRPLKNASLEDQKLAEISYIEKNPNFKVGSFVAVEFPNNRLGVAEKGSSIKRELLFVVI